MKLKKLTIRNFRSIKTLDLTFPESNLLVLVGANNAGKSNIIKAIDAICGEGWFGKDKMEDHDFYLRNRATPCKLTLTFDNGRTATISSTAPTKWTDYRDQYGNKLYTQVKDDFPCTYLGADRTFDKHLAFYDWTLIGKIRKRFHEKAQPLKTDLETKFSELTAIFDRVDGFTKFKTDFGTFFTEMQADTPARLDITFKPFTPANYFKTMQILATDPNQSDEPLDLGELGEGSRNTVLIALLRSYAINFRNTPEGISGILALEEPEIFLHPQARRHLYHVLRTIADAGIQVIISTHSASFIDTEHFDSIGQVTKLPDDEHEGRTHTTLTLVSKHDLVNHCIATGVPPEKVTTANITEFYRTTSNYRLNEAFFAKYIILVEGDTEELTIPEYLKTAGIDCDLQGISLIAVSGKNQLPKYWRLFSCFTPNLLCLFDADNTTTEGAASNQNLATCFGMTPDEFTTSDDRTFLCLTSKHEPATPLLALNPDFERAIATDFINQHPDDHELLNEYDQQARDLIRPIRDQSKGLIARYIARQLRTSHPGFVPGFIEQIAALLREAIGIPDPPTGAPANPEFL